MNLLKILNPNVRKSLIDEVSEPYVLTQKGGNIVYDYNRSLPASYFEHLEFPVSDFWYDYFSSKMNHAFGDKRGKALDVCAGTGTLSLNLMAKGYFDRCVAIDISKPAIDRLQQRISERKLNDLFEAKCDNIMDTSFGDNEFDCIAGNSFLHHLPDNRLFLREMYRILKPGGSICFSGEPTISCSALEGLILGNFIRLLKFFRLKKLNEQISMSDIWAYEKNSLKQILEVEGFKDIRIISFGFIVAILNEPTSFILYKLTGKSMQPVWYWKILSWLDKLLFSWVPDNYHSHFVITGKK